jgi:uncharacterized membrane protein YdjX (TVP38/TMEM64 family)
LVDAYRDTRVRGIVPRVLLVAALLVAAAWLVMHRGEFTPAVMTGRLHALGLWGPILFVGAYVAGSVLLLPGALLSIVGGAVFGPVWGALLDLVGATLGGAAAFLVARYLAADFVAARLRGPLRRVVAGVEAEGWRFVALTRLIPLVPFSLLNYALGLTRIRFCPFLIASAVCMIPASIAYTWLGYAGSNAAAGDAAAVRWALLALGVLSLGAFVPRLLQRMRARPAA